MACLRGVQAWRWWFVALVAWGACPVAANADRRVVTGATPFDGPVLAGPSVVYTEEDGTGLVLWQAAPGRAERRIQVLFSNDPATDEFAPATFDALTDLDASPLRVATGIRRVVTRVGIRGAQISSAPPGREPVGLITTGDGAWEGPSSCGDLSSGTVGVDADAVGYASFIGGCLTAGPGRPYAVRVRDLASPGEPAEGRTIATSEGAIGPVRLAGRFVAWRQNPPVLPSGSPAGPPPVVLVADRSTGAVVSSLTGASASYDVQEDGTLVAVGAGGKVTALTVGGSPRVLLPVGAERLRTAAGRVVVKRRAAGRDELLIVDASGAATVLARSPKDFLPFDFDGTRVTWTQEGCRGVSTLFVEDDPAAPDAMSVASCPFAIRKIPTRLRRGALELLLSCPKGCRGSVRLTIGSRSVRRAFDGSGRVRVRLGLRAVDLRTLRRSRRVVGRLRVRQELSGERVSTPADRRVTIRG